MQYAGVGIDGIFDMMGNDQLRKDKFQRNNSFFYEHSSNISILNIHTLSSKKLSSLVFYHKKHMAIIFISAGKFIILHGMGSFFYTL
jgi:hypothetical protein